MPEQDFERAFASLAYAELEQKVPGLFPYLIGFQLIDKNDDDSRAIGVFGFKAGQQWYYTPVFWLNGRVKGYDLLYIASQDLFVPMQEAWVNYIINRQPYTMGESKDKTPAQLGASSPDFSIFHDSPLSKSSEADPRCLVKQAAVPVQGGFDLVEKLRDWPAEFTSSFLKTMETNEKFAEAALTFYSPEKIQSAVNEVAFKTALMSKNAETSHYVSGNKKKVQVLHGDSEQLGIGTFTPLTTEEQEAKMRGDAVIRDDRDADEKSEVYDDVQFDKTFQTPSTSGLWRVLKQDGTLSEAFVSRSPVPVGEAKVPPTYMVVDPVSKKYVCATGVFARTELSPDVLKARFDSLPKFSSLSIGDVAMLIDEHSRLSFPFDVQEKTSTQDGNTILKVSDDTKIKRSPTSMSTVDQCTYVDREFDMYDNGQYIQTQPVGKSMRAVSNTLFVNPEDVRVIKLGKVSETSRASSNSTEPIAADDSDSGVDWYDFRKLHNLELGTEATVDHQLRSVGFRKLSMAYDGDSELVIRYDNRKLPRMAKAAAQTYLVKEVGLDTEMAKALVKKARTSSDHRVGILVKQAISLDPAQAYFDETYQAPVQEQSVDTETIPSDTADRSTMRQDIIHPVDEQAQAMAVQAANAGQKDVFDISALMGMVRTSRLEEHLGNFIKDIIVGNDRIGRLLFLFYWHFDEFTDRYGDEDMIELEDLLRETFRQVGDLVLFLTQKSLESDALATGSVIDL
jgi:hypothetical protein